MRLLTRTEECFCSPARKLVTVVLWWLSYYYYYSCYDTDMNSFTVETSLY